MWTESSSFFPNFWKSCTPASHLGVPVPHATLSPTWITAGKGLRLVPFLPFTSLRVFGRAGGLGGLYGHHVCVLSFLWLPRVLCCSSWLPELTGVRSWEVATHLTAPASLFSVSPCARKCKGQTPLLPYSCCGSVLRSPSNFMPDLVFWVLGFLGHWEPTGRCYGWGERETPGVS